MDKKSVSQGLAVSSIGFGALAMVTPGLMLKVYGAPTSPTARAMTRYWGTRNVVLGFLLLQFDGKSLDLLLNAGTALNLTDAALELIAPAIDGSPVRSSLQASATSAIVGAVAGYAASLD